LRALNAVFGTSGPITTGTSRNDSVEIVPGSGPPIDFGQNYFRMKSLKHIAGNVPVAGPLQWEPEDLDHIEPENTTEMKKATITFLFAAALMAVFSFAVMAQTTTPRAKEMEYKRDDTERLNLLSEALLADPLSMAYIFVYPGPESPEGGVSASIKSMREYLIVRRRMDTNRMVFAEGPMQETQKMQIWLVPDGAEAPKPLPAVAQGPAVKVDEYSKANSEEEMARLDMFTLELQNRPNDEGYIIVYAGRTSRAGEAKAIIKRILKYLVMQRGFDRARLVTIDGGRKEKVTVELWAVPEGATPPKAKPTVGVKKK
jgi:hypothetical protein